MRAPHPNIPEPPAQRLQVGDFIADLTARELRRIGSGVVVKMTVKTQGVLVALALQPGQVVTREELMDRVWPNTFPTGDVLTQAVTALRRAVGDNADAPRYVETIAKSGYRLLAPAQWLDEPAHEVATPPGADALPPGPPAHRRRLLPAGLAVAAILLAFMLIRRETPAPVVAAVAPAVAESTVIAASVAGRLPGRLRAKPCR